MKYIYFFIIHAYFVPFSREIRPDSNIREISPKAVLQQRESGKLSCFNFNLLTNVQLKVICAVKHVAPLRNNSVLYSVP